MACTAEHEHTRKATAHISTSNSSPGNCQHSPSGVGASVQTIAAHVQCCMDQPFNKWQHKLTDCHMEECRQAVSMQAGMCLRAGDVEISPATLALLWVEGDKGRDNSIGAEWGRQHN